MTNLVMPIRRTIALAILAPVVSAASTAVATPARPEAPPREKTVLIVTVMSRGAHRCSRPVQLKSAVIQVRRNGALVLSVKTGLLERELRPGSYRISASRRRFGGGGKCETRIVHLTRGHFVRVHLFCPTK